MPEGPVVSFGLAGGLHDGLECGEVLDATRVVDADGVVLWEGGPLGVSGARTATILAVDEIVDDPAERRTLHERTGADAIDMESGALARTGRLAGCLRAISDTPSRPLGPLDRDDGRERQAPPGRHRAGPRRPAPHGPRARRRPPRPHGLATSCYKAERGGRMTAQNGQKRVLLAAPRSFCAGVDRAIEIVEKLLKTHGPPVYVRHEIVHNDNVVRRLEAMGAVFIDHEDEVPEGEICVLSAHGVAPAVRENCEKKGLRVVDAVCPLVSKVHAEARRYADSGHVVALIGHANHVEVIGTKGERPDRSSSSSRRRTRRSWTRTASRWP